MFGFISKRLFGKVFILIFLAIFMVLFLFTTEATRLQKESIISSLESGSKTMADALKKTDSELKNMQATQRKVDSFRGLQSSITKTSDTLARYRTEHRLLKEQGMTEAYTKFSLDFLIS